MKLEVVRADTADFDDWSHVVSWVYRREAATTDTYPVEPGESRYVARADGRPAAACTVYPFDVARNDFDLRCGGVAGVATLPEFRREGVADALMREVLSGMREDGFAVSALYPFRSTYYRKFGYENCGWRWQIKCPSERLPSLQATLPIRQIETSDLTTLNSVYIPFIRQRSGSPLRSEEDWKHRMGKKTPMVYGIGDPLQAYLWVNLEEFWGEAVVGEIAWITKDGYETALSLIRGLCSNQTTATWNEPPDSPFVANHMDQGVTASHSRPTMFRLVDLEKALASFKTEHDWWRFCFELVDETCEWNNGVWTAEFDEGTFKLQRRGRPGFKINVREFSQALMGQPSLEELADQGRVEVTDYRAVGQASAVMPSSPVVCMEFF